MRTFFLALGGFAASMVAVPSDASAETYQEYLARLRDICSVECLQPRQFQRTARKRRASDETEMALIMDVVEVRRNGDKFELYDRDEQGSILEERAILGSAGIDTSFGTGIGGVPRGRQVNRSPNVIVIEMDKQTFFDVLNIPTPVADPMPGNGADNSDGIVVDGDREMEAREPSLKELRSYFRNRRIVVRGKPRLQAVWVGARIDRRRKQVTLELESADSIALLPRYDENGEPVLSNPLAD